ncbi:hypothetical protein DVH24_017520 [Malus domestica]|uniref:Uncharacterized protein n=1 Tax=Malus domestica TaxID=3750 RepID=A0A498IW59_MALDO|nr:hypothetical protein DVH24_017520 [Malus domestica]
MLRLLSAIASYLHLQGHAPDDKSKQERTYALTKDSLCFVSNENGVSLAPILKLSSSTECLKRGVKHVAGNMFESIPHAQSIMMKKQGTHSPRHDDDGPFSWGQGANSS